MEIIFTSIISIAFGYLLQVVLPLNKKPKELTEDELERQRREKVEKSWQELFNYNETIATRGYRDGR